MDSSNGGGPSAREPFNVPAASSNSGVHCDGEPAPQLRSTLVDVFQLALPNIAGYLLNLINELTNTIFIGRVGTDVELAAVGLGNMMQNCVGLSVGFGVCAALDTFVSQAYGAGQHDVSCRYFQRCKFLVTLQLIWMVPVLYFTEDILNATGQDPGVAHHAGLYNRVSVFGLFAIFQLESARKFLQNRCIVIAPAAICAVCSVFHVVWCALFVAHWGMGNTGAGWANVLTWYLEFIGITVYMLWTSRNMGFSKRDVLIWEWSRLRDIAAYSKVAGPSALQLCTEWWFWEIGALVVGYMGSIALAAHVATLNFVAVSFMPAIGINASTATLVGNAIGARKPRLARQTVWTCVSLNVLVWLLLAMLMIFARRELAMAYSRDEQVREVMHSLLCIFAAAGFFDSSQNVMGGALRGMGQQQLAAVAYILTYYGLMLPVGCAMGFWMSLGVQGFWYSFAIGTAITTVVFTVRLTTLNYEEVAAAAAERMDQEGSGCLAEIALGAT